jgi:hypothetical protein
MSQSTVNPNETFDYFLISDRRRTRRCVDFSLIARGAHSWRLSDGHVSECSHNVCGGDNDLANHDVHDSTNYDNGGRAAAVHVHFDSTRDHVDDGADVKRDNDDPCARVNDDPCAHYDDGANGPSHRRRRAGELLLRNTLGLGDGKWIKGHESHDRNSE